MATIKELREQQARIATNARAKFDEIKDDMPEDRAAEIEREFDAMMADHDKIGDRIERLAKIEAAEKRVADAADAEERAKRESRRPGAEPGEDRGDGEVTYRDAFHAYLRSQGNVAALSAEERSVLNTKFNKVELRAQTTSNTAGGYTVPTEMMSILVKSMAADGPMYDPGVTREFMTNGGNPMLIPTVNDLSSTAGASAGEGVTLTDDGGKDVTFGQKTLNAYSFDTEWLRVSKELADDSIFAMEQIVGELLGERLGRLANAQLTTGSGSSAPNGIVTASSLGKTAAGAAAITGDEIIDLLHSVDAKYRESSSAAFMFNDSTLAYIRKLKDGNGNYLWQMGNIQQGVPGTILGYRYYVNQAMASIATGNKTMLFGDLRKYFVRKVGDPLIGAIQDKDFWPGFGIAGYIRFDGELTDTAAVKHLIQA